MSQVIHKNSDTGIHTSAIHNIAEQYSMDEEIVKDLYELELTKLLKEGVRITAFLPVICVRHVKELIISNRNR